MIVATIRRWAHWKRGRRLALGLFVLIVLALLATQARKYDWHEIVAAIQAYSASTLILATLFTALTYAIYSCYDIIGRSYSGAALRVRQAMAVAVVSYIFNQNFGALFGTVGLRLRLYSSLGVGLSNISKIVTLSVVTNWLGYLFLSGVLLSFRLIELPASWAVSVWMLQLVGALCLCAVLLYLLLCRYASRRHLEMFRTRIELPSHRIAIAQLALSVAHWPVTAGIIYVLLQGCIDFVEILGAFMLTSIAIVVTHLPAGIGVLEGMFILLLGERVPHTQLLAALLVFRAVFHVGALGVAGLMYVALEARFNAEKPPTREPG